MGASPDGRWIAFDMSDFNAECDALWIVDVQTGDITRVFTKVHPVSPFWLNGDTILFSGENDNEQPQGVYRISISTGKLDRLLAGPYLSPFVCDDGKNLYFSSGPKLGAKGDSWNPFYDFHIWKTSMSQLPK